MQNNNLSNGALEFAKMINSIQTRIDMLEKLKLEEFRIDIEYYTILNSLIEKFPDLESKSNNDLDSILKNEKKLIKDFIVVAGFLYMPHNISTTNYKYIDEFNSIVNDFRVKHNYPSKYVKNKDIDLGENFKLELKAAYWDMITQLKNEIKEINKMREINLSLISNIRKNIRKKLFSKENNLSQNDYHNFIRYIKNNIKIKEICLNFILVASILKYDFLFFSSLEIYNLLNGVAKIPNIDGQYPNMLNSIQYFETFYKFHFYNFIN